MPDSEHDSLQVLCKRVRDENLYTLYSSDKLVRRIQTSSETEKIILSRFLKARRFNPEEAFKSFVACLSFRKAEGVNEIGLEEYKDPLATFPFIFTGIYFSIWLTIFTCQWKVFIRLIMNRCCMEELVQWIDSK